MSTSDSQSQSPLGQFADQHRGLVQGLKYGGWAGAIGGALYDWGANRGYWGDRTMSGPISGQGTVNTMLGNDIQGTQDAIWGSGSQTPSGYTMDPNAVSMGPPAPDGGEDSPMRGPEARRSGDLPGLYGIGNMMVGGAPVIEGYTGNDMNQVAVIRREPGN